MGTTLSIILFGLKVPLTIGSVRTHYVLICLKFRITRRLDLPLRKCCKKIVFNESLFSVKGCSFGSGTRQGGAARLFRRLFFKRIAGFASLLSVKYFDLSSRRDDRCDDKSSARALQK